MESNPLVYECRICYGLNFAAKLHCSTCGTIPAKYSFMRVTVTVHPEPDIYRFVEIQPAKGCERQARRKASKTNFRTVPLDYYATGE